MNVNNTARLLTLTVSQAALEAYPWEHLGAVGELGLWFCVCIETPVSRMRMRAKEKLVLLCVISGF